MPANFGIAYGKANGKYQQAATKEEKMEALEEMITACPKHKGTESVLAELRTKLKKLREQKEAKVKRKAINVPKEGEAQIAVIGVTNSGKSMLLKKLTNANPKIADHPYTTTKPEVGMMIYKDLNIQLVEIPSTFTGELLSIARNSDIVLVLIDSRGGEEEQMEVLQPVLQRMKKVVYVKNNDSAESIKSKIWSSLGKIHVYTKLPSKTKDLPAFALREGATVKDAASRIHKDFVKKFRFARIYGPSAKFAGQTVGLDHKLKDGDVVEIHLK